MATSGMNPPDIDDAIVRQGAGDEPDTSWIDEHLPEDEDLADSPDAVREGYRPPSRPVEVRVEIDDEDGNSVDMTLHLTRDEGDNDVQLSKAIVAAAASAACGFRLSQQAAIVGALGVEMTRWAQGGRTPGSVGGVIDAYREIERLVNASGLPLSPKSIADRVAELVAFEKRAQL